MDDYGQGASYTSMCTSKSHHLNSFLQNQMNSSITYTVQFHSWFRYDNKDRKLVSFSFPRGRKVEHPSAATLCYQEKVCVTAKWLAYTGSWRLMEQPYVGGFSRSTLKREVWTHGVSDFRCFFLIFAFVVVSMNIFETHIISIKRKIRNFL